mgnify:CR=1 FL=1
MVDKDKQKNLLEEGQTKMKSLVEQHNELQKEMSSLQGQFNEVQTSIVKQQGYLEALRDINDKN